MERWDDGGIFARMKEIDVNDLGIRRLQSDPRVNRVLNFDLPFNPGLEPIWNLAS